MYSCEVESIAYGNLPEAQSFALRNSVLGKFKWKSTLKNTPVSCMIVYTYKCFVRAVQMSVAIVQ